MNSYNHYAYGAIGEWMYRVVAGLDMDRTAPAYKQIRIQPRIGGKELTYVRASHDSMYGKILSAWSITHEEVTMEVEIPVNTVAEIILPFAEKEGVKENGISITKAEGIFDIRQTEYSVSLVVGSGHYRFVYKNQRGLRTIYSKNTILIDLLLKDKITKILEEYVPGISNPHSQLAQLRAEPIHKLLNHPASKLTENRLNALIDELNSLERELDTVGQGRK